MSIKENHKLIREQPLSLSLSLSLSLMEPDSNSSKSEVAFERLPMIRVYKDGRVERLLGTDFVPPSTDPETGVSSKDVTIPVAAAATTATSEPSSHVISARLFLPKLTDSRKLPLLIYFHGGGFCISSPFTAIHHGYLNALVAEAKVVAVAVDHRKAPEHPIPVAYEDAWAAIQWAASHCDGDGPEAWLNEHADFGRVFLSGESSGEKMMISMYTYFSHMVLVACYSQLLFIYFHSGFI
ncbi:hypothetical protein ACJRO7_022362 [Eucalyptus globulus]|uniref:Alpha/beta hydrolase fold-3 domain-containing protein n=1 Tax=Eucalyptus globulus TaxID=34317 RepID=A0ABD3JZI6_EUCGL